MVQHPTSPPRSPAIKSSSIFGTATLKKPRQIKSTSTNPKITNKGNAITSLKNETAPNSPTTNPSEYLSSNNGNDSRINSPISIDRDLEISTSPLPFDDDIFYSGSDDKMSDIGTGMLGTNDTSDTYFDSFRLGNNVSDEETVLNEAKLFNDIAKLKISSPTPSKRPVPKSNAPKPIPIRSEPRQGRRASTLVLADLERYYTQPLAEASKALGLSATMLKKVCRGFGIRRWPHRQLASIDRTIARFRERLEAQEKSHFYSLEGECRTSANIREKVAQLEEKKDAICRLTSQGQSLHNITKSKTSTVEIESSKNLPAFKSNKSLTNDRNASTIPPNNDSMLQSFLSWDLLGTNSSSANMMGTLPMNLEANALTDPHNPFFSMQEDFQQPATSKQNELHTPFDKDRQSMLCTQFSEAGLNLPDPSEFGNHPLTPRTEWLNFSPSISNIGTNESSSIHPGSIDGLELFLNDSSSGLFSQSNFAQNY
mmetsp:Transcript_10742/g.15158  ORF Transcript_10742/g.15158 Transcript_10742/m.15158 type:complete len:483 (+) Transcript_10742:98-1546(+)